ncbi:MAG: hypothetical protein LBT64_01975 [Puniceicoccales bacterium]|jgi:hypothetical protein|nr:hypothetical protein [Puniceicoccales bacterium]
MWSLGRASAQAQQIRVGDVYVINENVAVPLFTEPRIEFEYEAGSRGSDCHELKSVLFPGFYVRIREILDGGILRVDCRVDNAYVLVGYVHEKLVERNMSLRSDVNFDGIGERVKIPSVAEIGSRMQEILCKKVPYCRGGSFPKEVKLDGLYRFRRIGNNAMKYMKFACYGFDAAGLLHYVSNGYLPHSIRDLADFEMKLFVISTAKPIQTRIVDEIINSLMDTDIVLFIPQKHENRRHISGNEWESGVLMFHRFGFVESRGRYSGIVRTNSMDAEARLIQMFNAARNAGSDLYVIRWHPELLRATYDSGNR